MKIAIVKGNGMNDINKNAIKAAVAAAGKQLEGKMPYSPQHPNGRNPYAHLWKSIKDKYGHTYSELPDVLAADVLMHIETERLYALGGYPNPNQMKLFGEDVRTTHDIAPAAPTRAGTSDMMFREAQRPVDEFSKERGAMRKAPKLLRVSLKDPDGFSEAIDEAVRESLAGLEDEDERDTLEDLRREKTEAALEKWVRYSEYVTLEFDLANGTARVVPLK